MAERSLEEIMVEVRQLTGSIASAQLAGTDDQSSGPGPERLRARAVRLIEDSLGGHLREALARIETEHRKNLNDLWREQATLLNRLCDEIEQVLPLRQADERALQERAIETTLTAVERRLMPEIDELRLLLQRRLEDLSQQTARPRLLSSVTAAWLAGLIVAFIGGALLAPELGQALEAAVSALG